MKRVLLSALCLLSCLCASAELRIKEPCSNGMVLQQKTEAMVWGHASPGASISVRTGWNGKYYSTKTDGNGTWKVKVNTPEASYNKYEIKVSGDGSSLIISDVLIGEVWVASGQSNMEMPIRGFFNCPVEGAQEVISSTNLKDKVRMCYIQIYQPDEPQEDVHSTEGWQDATQETVSEMSATAFFFARKLQSALNVPVGILSLPRGGASVESWLPKKTLASWGDDVSQAKIDSYTEWTVPYRMYNGMQHPVQGYTAKGFIWYQGCTNVGEHERFVYRMKELIRQWRADWGDQIYEMPFYMCEIAPYLYKGDQADQAALLRQAQHQVAAETPNCEIIVTNDLAYNYERDQIHPCQKRQVGERLAYLAMNRDYGFKKLACYSPEAIRVYKNPLYANEICVELSNCPNGLDRWQEIKGLEVCGSEGVFKRVTYAYYEWGLDGKNYLRIRHEGVHDPCEVRYGWGDFVPGNLHNAEGLPVAPFDLKL